MRHHALLFEGPTSDPATTARAQSIEKLLGRYAVEIVIHVVPAGQRTLHARYGVRRPWLFLIRPDGHVAYAAAPDDINSLASYLARFYDVSAP